MYDGSCGTLRIDHIEHLEVFCHLCDGADAIVDTDTQGGTKNEFSAVFTFILMFHAKVCRRRG